jgi:hypothetical protein
MKDDHAAPTQGADGVKAWPGMAGRRMHPDERASLCIRDSGKG